MYGIDELCSGAGKNKNITSNLLWVRIRDVQLGLGLENYISFYHECNVSKHIAVLEYTSIIGIKLKKNSRSHIYSS